jgi:hypothetical protein
VPPTQLGPSTANVYQSANRWNAPVNSPDLTCHEVEGPQAGITGTRRGSRVWIWDFSFIQHQEGEISGIQAYHM